MREMAITVLTGEPVWASISMIAHAKHIFEDAEIEWTPGTVADIAGAYLERNPLDVAGETRLELDRRGHGE